MSRAAPSPARVRNEPARLDAKHRSIVDHLNEQSRTRELTDFESLLLQRSLAALDGRRLEHRINRALAAYGVGRRSFPDLGNAA